MRSNKIETYKKSLKLSDIQKEVLVGTLLGDGCLETANQGRTYRLKIEHTIKQKDYVDWKYSIFQNWVLAKPRVREYTAYGTKRTNYRFWTVSHGPLRFYGQQFYKNGKKVLPKFISKLLTARALAVWFMDDGSIKSNQHKSLVIHAQSFTKNDLNKLIVILETKFGIKTALRKRADGYGYVIYILSKSVDKFIQLIEPFMLSSMRYKLGNTIAQKVTEAFIKVG